MMQAVNILVGAACGVLSGFGIGGGSLLMIWMTAVLTMEQTAAQGINLLYFLPTAAAALIFHVKNKAVVWRVVIPAALCGTATAILGALLSSNLNSDLLRRCFGFFLLAIGIKELFTKAKR